MKKVAYLKNDVIDSGWWIQIFETEFVISQSTHIKGLSWVICNNKNVGLDNKNIIS